MAKERKRAKKQRKKEGCSVVEGMDAKGKIVKNEQVEEYRSSKKKIEGECISAAETTTEELENEQKGGHSLVNGGASKEDDTSQNEDVSMHESDKISRGESEDRRSKGGRAGKGGGKYKGRIERYLPDWMANGVDCGMCSRLVLYVLV